MIAKPTWTVMDSNYVVAAVCAIALPFVFSKLGIKIADKLFKDE